MQEKHQKHDKNINHNPTLLSIFYKYVPEPFNQSGKTLKPKILTKT